VVENAKSVDCTPPSPTWAPLKARYLRITVAIVDFLESLVSLLNHYICYCGPLWNSRT